MTYSKPIVAQILELFDEYIRHTSAAPTEVARVVSGDKALLNRLARSAPRSDTIDLIMGRFSTIWPKDLEWPEGISRAAPVALAPGDVAPGPSKHLRSNFDVCPTCGRRVSSLHKAEQANG